MRKAYLVAAAVIIAASAYAALSASDVWDAPGPVGTGYTDLASLPVVSASEIESAAIPQEMADTNNDFATDIYRQISQDGGNVFFSPLSIYTAFSLLYEGAGGEGAGELEGAFGFEPDAQARHNMTARAMASINRDDQHAELVMANALWPVEDAIRPEYTDVARSTYLADVAHPGDSTVDGINGWVSDVTNGKISEVIDEMDPAAVLVITNAIYFKGSWEKPFPPGFTRENTWYGASGGSAEYMNIMMDPFDYAEYGGLQVLRMPYEGDRMSMVVLLPESGGMGELEESLSAEQLREWTDGLREKKLRVFLPKFTVSTSYTLTDSLKTLGITHMFREGSLEGIAERMLVSDVLHAGFVDVNEEGTEAAAFTSLPLTRQSAPVVPEFNANRPFLFLIQDDESGAILFIGRLSEP